MCRRDFRANSLAISAELSWQGAKIHKHHILTELESTMLKKNIKIVTLAALTALATAASPAIAAPFDSLSVTQEDKSFSSYTKVYIAPTEMALDQRETPRRPRFSSRRDPYVPADDQAKKAADLQDTLMATFGKHFEVVAEPGPGVLTISPKLTRLVPSRLTLSSRATTLGRDVNRTVYAGGASFDVTISEGDTVLASLEDRYANSFADLTPRVGYWQDADEAFSFFSTKLARYIRKN